MILWVTVLVMLRVLFGVVCLRLLCLIFVCLFVIGLCVNVFVYLWSLVFGLLTFGSTWFAVGAFVCLLI